MPWPHLYLLLSKSRPNSVVKNIPRGYHGMSCIPGGARNLLPLAYEKTAPNIRPKRSKTGKNRDFLQKTVLLAFFTQLRLEHVRRFSVFLPCPAQKFPTKITGNFLDYTRELSANNRELYFSHLRESVCYLYAICLQMPHRVKRLKLRHDTDSKHLLKSVCFLYPSY